MGKRKLISDGTDKKQTGQIQKFLTRIVITNALKYDWIKNDRQKVIALLKLYRQNPEDEYVPRYLAEISNGSRKRIEISLENLGNILIENGVEDDSIIGIGICTATQSPDLVKNYLNSRPSQFLGYINILSHEEVEEVLSKINDQEYCAQLLLALNITNLQEIAKFFPHIEDEYIRAQIILSHTDNCIVKNRQEAMENIREFLKIKEEFLKLSETERVEFLCRFGADRANDEDSVSRKKRNLIKQSLLQYIPKHEDRMRVIDTLEHKVSENMASYEILTRQMMLEYIKDNFAPSEEQIEKVHIALNSYDLFLTDELQGEVGGVMDPYSLEIRIANHLLNSKILLIAITLHERAHTFSFSDFLISGLNQDDIFEEGIADAFQIHVINHYFRKHSETMHDGEKITPQLPILNTSSYFLYDMVTQLNLWLLASKNLDIRAIQEYLLGDKKEFFNLFIGENSSQGFQQNYLGQPFCHTVGIQDLLRTDDMYRQLDRNSLYFAIIQNIGNIAEFHVIKEIYARIAQSRTDNTQAREGMITIQGKKKAQNTIDDEGRE